MTPGQTVLRQAIVLSSALIYWGGVIVHAHRIQRHIKRSPNIRPRGIREKLLWLGWFLVIAGWMGQPLLIGQLQDVFLFSFANLPVHTSAVVSGLFLALCGQAGTFWCYSALGLSWRMGVNRKERTVLIQHGPYRFIRHPIYLFQIVILSGMTLLLPTFFSLLILLVHFVCISTKAADEEAYLESVHPSQYRAYRSRTGRFLPRWRGVHFPH